MSRENRLISREKDADRLKEELEGLAENLRAESRAGQLHLEEENRRLGQEQARLDKLAAALSSERTELQAEMARERKTVEDLKASAARHKARTQESCLEEQDPGGREGGHAEEPPGRPPAGGRSTEQGKRGEGSD